MNRFERFPGRRRWAAPAGLLLAAGLLGAWLNTGRVGPARHTISDLVSVAISRGDSGAVWTTQRVQREIWIRSDGSGRLREQTDGLEVLPSRGELQWTGPLPTAPPPREQTFGASGLLYLPTTVIDERMSDVAAHGTGGQSLRTLASLLAETAPTPADVRRAIQIASDLPLVTSRSDGDTLTFIGDGSFGGGTRVEITFDTALSTFVRERWYALAPQEGLGLDPPILMFERTIISSAVTSS